MEPKSPSFTIPGAIIIGATIIAIALIYVLKPASKTVIDTRQNQTVSVGVPDVSATDHILGNPNAPIKLVEYSDPSCPYCKIFNPTMKQIIDQYGPSGKVAWVYRHFPIDKPGTTPDGGILHPNAGHEAQAFECAASLGGNTAFWAYEQKFYDLIQSDKGIGMDQRELPNIAKAVGLDPVAFNECVASGKFKDKIEKQYIDGINAGIEGTPMTYIFTPSGSKIPLKGAVNYNTIKSALDALSADSK
jgi:protein-disulfide isomerase